MRYPLIIGNWKLNGNQKIINKLINNLRKSLSEVSICTVVVAPPEIYLDLVKRRIKGSHIVLGAQNVDIHLSGAFTGETSAKMLKDIGVKYIIVGHSERRIYHKESNEIIAKKFAIVKEQNIIPVLCIGETKVEKESGETEKICACQIDAIIKTHGVTAFKDAVIAYEPVWAIGTGKSATKEQVQKVHKFIRNHIAKSDSKIAEQVIIQYGGSVDISNVAVLSSQEDVDGVLVGSSSLKVKDFTLIVKAAEEVNNHKLSLHN